MRKEVVESVVRDYMSQKNVMDVIVIDNHSSDNTVDIAKKIGAIVIEKKANTGFPDSCVMVLKESLKTNANIMVLTECDGTFSGYDMKKMIPYLDNCDMVIGTRQVQVLSEKGNQNSMFYVWGNYLLAKLIQIKYFSLLHLGIIQLTDVGCVYRCLRREALEKIIDKLTDPKTGEVVIDSTSGIFAALVTTIAIEKDLRIVEIPITFKKRMGISKTEAQKKTKGIKYGLQYLWYILSS